MLLHFGAVDYRATVWVNGQLVGRHEGGYTPFTCDISAAVDSATRCEVVVRAEDDPTDLEKPRGKQDWTPTPHSIWYHADDRHLADGLGRTGALDVDRAPPLDPQPGTLGDWLQHLVRGPERQRVTAARPSRISRHHAGR